MPSFIRRSSSSNTSSPTKTGTQTGIAPPPAPRASLEKRNSLVQNTVAPPPSRQNSLTNYSSPLANDPLLSPAPLLADDAQLPDIISPSMLPRLSLVPKPQPEPSVWSFRRSSSLGESSHQTASNLPATRFLSSSRNSSHSAHSSTRFSLVKEPYRCRFCLIPVTSQGERLMHVCQCRDLVSRVHPSCLLSRIGANAAQRKCDICHSPFSLRPSMTNWFSHTVHRHLYKVIIDFLCLVVMLPATFLVIYFAVAGLSHIIDKKDHMKSWSTAGLILVAMSMLTGLLLWSTLSIKNYRSSYSRYHRRIHALSGEKNVKSPDHQSQTKDNADILDI